MSGRAQLVRGSRLVQAAVVEKRTGVWVVRGIPGRQGELGPFPSVLRATRHALKNVGSLPAWRVDVLDAGGVALTTYNSDDAMG